MNFRNFSSFAIFSYAKFTAHRTTLQTLPYPQPQQVMEPDLKKNLAGKKVLGRQVMLDGRVYEGKIKDGKPEGKGVIIWKDGTR